MQSENPPLGELRFIPVREGRYRVIVMDQHKSINEEAAESLEALSQWLLEWNDWGLAILPDDLEQIQDLLDLHGAVHVRTSMDFDLVFVKGGAPRG